jgi:hypothetical protein
MVIRRRRRDRLAGWAITIAVTVFMLRDEGALATRRPRAGPVANRASSNAGFGGLVMQIVQGAQ